MQRSLKLLFTLILALSLPTATTLRAQTDIDFNDDRDNDSIAALADSLAADSTLTGVVANPNDTLPWPQNVQANLDEMLQADMFQTSQVGMLIYDLDADSVIYRHNERQLMRPASVMKIITAITTLDRLGGSHKFSTQLCYTGRVDSCTLVGDVYCVGGFDPRFNGDDMRAFAESLRKMGIDTIRGNLYADTSMKEAAKFGEGWCWDDDNPVLSPLLINRKDEFMARFIAALNRDSIYVTGATYDRQRPADANCIITRFHTIDQILMRMLKQSDNLYAESMLYQLAASTGKKRAKAHDAATLERQLFEKLGLDGSRYRLADGSGLSLYNYVSAELLVRLLRYAYNDENIYNHLLPALPIAGEDGTLKSRMRGEYTKGNVHAKTGTLTGIASLAGYLTAHNGHHICFAILNQGVMHGKNGRRFQDRVCTLLCKPAREE